MEFLEDHGIFKSIPDKEFDRFLGQGVEYKGILFVACVVHQNVIFSMQ